MPHDDALTWLKRLEPKLKKRQGEFDSYDDFYEGNHPLVFASEKFKQVFGGVFDEFSDNWCPVIVDAVEERLNPLGFRFGDDPAADDDANRFWQANQLDAQSQMGHLEALIGGESAVTVWANPDDENTPRITVEHPTQVIVATDPADPRRRLAAVKIWKDEWTNGEFATVYMPDGIYKFRATRAASSRLVLPRSIGTDRWEPREVDGEQWPLPNPLEVVSVVPLRNRPRMLKPGVSEIKNVIPLQNAINKTITDMLVGSELGGFAARWAVGWSPEEDPETRQLRQQKLTDYFNRFLWTEDPNAKFGQFPEINLELFVKAVDLLVQHLAAQSRTPPHYLNTSADRLSGESIKAAETGLVAKVRRKMVFFEEAWEEVVRLGFAVIGDPRADEMSASTIWKDPESRTEAEHIDAVVKRSKIGVPTQQLWEDADYTPEQITRMREMIRQEALDRTGVDLTDLFEDDETEVDEEPAAAGV